MTPDPEAVFRTCCRQALPRRAAVLAAVSGGNDSMALLGAAHRILGEHLRVVTVHHGLRAGAADDVALVEQVCADLGVPCVRAEARPQATDRRRGESGARRRRLTALARTARRLETPWILLGHHLDDALETMLLQRERGHGGDRARAGPPSVRPLGAHAIVVRPFLTGPHPPSRRDLRRYREGLGLPYADDPTNRDLAIPRNRIRARLREATPAQLQRLCALRARARRRLQRRLGIVTAALERHLRPVGLGCALDRGALSTPNSETRQEEYVTELLRLLGACLRRPRRVDPRGRVVRRLLDAVRNGHGSLELPATPDGLVLHITSERVDLPHEALNDLLPAARALHAVACNALHL